MATLETFKQDMDLVNSFSGTFIDSIKVSKQKVNVILGDFDKALEEERQNKMVLQSIESTISENELNNIFVEFTGLKSTLIEKHTEYNSLIQNNTKSIQSIAKTIKDKNDKIQDIKTTILDIEQLMSKFKIV